MKTLEKILHIAEGYARWAADAVSGRTLLRSVRRYAICKRCEHNVGGICGLCGCVLKAKVRVMYDLDENGKSVDGCPEKKW